MLTPVYNNCGAGSVSVHVHLHMLAYFLALGLSSLVSAVCSSGSNTHMLSQVQLPGVSHWYEDSTYDMRL